MDGLHPCRIEARPDVYVSGQLLVRCRCHEDVVHTWRPGDDDRVCPVTGALVAGDPP